MKINKAWFLKDLTVQRGKQMNKKKNNQPFLRCEKGPADVYLGGTGLGKMLEGVVIP